VLVALACLAGAAGACEREERAAPATGSSTPIAAAETFVGALDDGDVATLVRVSQTPFAFREQQWTNAPDGYGFVLGEASDRVLTDPAALEPFLAELLQRVSVRSRSAAPNPSSRESLLAEQLAGAPAPWPDLELVVFLRGEGDVEHIAIVGVDRRTGRITGLYVN
jgi:hypothetical protein